MRTGSPHSLFTAHDALNPISSMLYQQYVDVLRRRTSARVCVICLASILTIGMAQTAAALDFSAERIVRNGESVVTAHVNAKDDRWRFEFSQPQRGASVIIVRADLGTAWLIFSRRRQYVEEPMTREHRLTMSEKMEGEILREFVGDETLNGYPTELFEITVAGNGHTHQYYRWVTKAERFPLKTVSKQGKWSEEFRRLIFTKQSPLLFELPQRLDPADQSAGTQH